MIYNNAEIADVESVLAAEKAVGAMNSPSCDTSDIRECDVRRIHQSTERISKRRVIRLFLCRKSERRCFIAFPGVFIV